MFRMLSPDRAAVTLACALSLERPADLPGSFSVVRRAVRRLSGAAVALLLTTTTPVAAQSAVLDRGDAVVTGFSGIKPSPAPLPEGASPLDEFFIDPDGASAQVQTFVAPGSPQGQLISTPAKLQIKARQVGQVFAITVDDGRGGTPPNIYLGATSAYGLQIVLPDADADGAPERITKGAAGAAWMAGQFGLEAGGGPGTIWKVDGQTGAVSVFAALPDNSGPGIGDVVFDHASRQFFASDLDTGLIWRISETGQMLGSFDHGIAGRSAHGLAAAGDDGSRIDIQNPAFDSQDPETWALTAKPRRVHGMAIDGGRLYYAVDGQVWSIGVSASGFGDDARWELHAAGLAGDGPITDMTFDTNGRLYLAQRGAQRASYDYSVFAESEKSNVVRYRRETPDDPSTPGVWVAQPETYAIGLPAEHHHAVGGLALGLAHDTDGRVRYGACGQMLWSTGHRLRSGANDTEVGEADVHGLQGQDAMFVRPLNTPPQQSYFADYDGLFGDAAKSGHMGDVEIWQPCERGASIVTPTGPFPPGILLPGDGMLPEFPPHYSFHTNLRLTKRAAPDTCALFFSGWLCRYTVQVTNTGPDNYFGPIVVRDWLPATPPGALMGFDWTCANIGPSDNRCWRLGVFLSPGASTSMTAYAWVPDSYPKCHLTNAARIEWAPPGSIWNSDPTDDIDFATALIPAMDCDQGGKKTDLKIYKEPALACFEWQGHIRCAYKIRVENQGPGAYNGNIVVEDTVPNGATAIFSGPGWTTPCPNAGPVYTCPYPGASLPNIGDAVNLIVRVDLPPALAKQLGCKVKNEARITQAPGGSDLNTDPMNDMASATALVPAKICNPPLKQSNLKIRKTALRLPCLKHPGKDWCVGFRIEVTNTGPDAFNGQITVTDSHVIGTTMFIGGPGWSCMGDTCQTTAAVNLQKNPPSADSIALTVTLAGTAAEAKEMNCKLTNKARVDDPLGLPKNAIAADDTDEVTVDLPEKFCSKPMPKTNLRLTKAVDANGCLPGEGVSHCYYNVTVTNTGPGDYNDKIVVNEFIPAGTTGVFSWNCMGGTCTHDPVLLKPGERVVMGAQINVPNSLAKQLKCKVLNLAKITYAPGGSDQNTDATDDQDQATADLPAALCASTVPPSPPACPPGYRWDGERCDRGAPGCRPGWTPTPVKGQCCPPGKPWNAGQRQCGTDDTPPPQQGCPDGRVMKRGQCVVIDQAGCPAGTIGTLPNCRRPVCPEGTRGLYPHCRKIVTDPRPCPPGMRGVFPNCRGAVIDPPRKKCPQGMVGRFPKCRPIVRVCPPGTVGRPPLCRRIGFDGPVRIPGLRFPGNPPRFSIPGGGGQRGGGLPMPVR